MASHKFTTFKDLFDLCYENGVFAMVQEDFINQAEEKK
jgi:hypothetical protein